MKLSEFNDIVRYLSDDIYNDHYFEVVFETQISVLNVKSEAASIQADNKDDLCVQIDEFRRNSNWCGPSSCIADISIIPFFEERNE